MPLSWTLGDVLSQATARVGRRSDIAQSDASLWANQAYADVLQDLETFGESTQTFYSVNSGDSLLTLPADFDHAIVFSEDTDSGSALTLDQIAPERADAAGYYPVGRPQGYFIYSQQIQLWPSADSSINSDGASSGRSYRLRYVAQPETLVSTTSVPTSLDTQYRIGWLYRTEKYLHELVGNAEEAAEAELRYLNWASAAKDAKNRRDRSHSELRIALNDRGGRRRRHPRATNPSDAFRRF